MAPPVPRAREKVARPRQRAPSRVPRARVFGKCLKSPTRLPLWSSPRRRRSSTWARTATRLASSSAIAHRSQTPTSLSTSPRCHPVKAPTRAASSIPRRGRPAPGKPKKEPWTSRQSVPSRPRSKLCRPSLLSALRPRPAIPTPPRSSIRPRSTSPETASGASRRW